MHTLGVWPRRPAEIKLTQGEIHVWHAWLGVGADELDKLERTLSSEEQSRAARFIFPDDRERFVAARGILRDLVGVYSGRPPSELQFIYGARGKPAVSLEDPYPAIRFNLSHSHGLAVYAFSLTREVGIDVELVRSDFAANHIAQRYFSARELEELCAVPSELRWESFFRCWTRKEAYVKAHGEGLHIPLDSFDVSLTPGQPETLTSADASRWKLRSVAVSDGYVAALVGEGNDWTLRQFRWSHEEKFDVSPGRPGHHAIKSLKV